MVALGASGALRDSFTVTATDDHGAATDRVITVTVHGANDAPTVATVAGDLGTVAEDNTRLFTEAELIRAVGGTDVDHDTLHVGAVTVDAAYGSFARQSNGDWLFTPRADVNHDAIPVTVTINDGTLPVDGHATLSITPVTDPATVGLEVTTSQPVMAFDRSGTGSVVNMGGLSTGAMDHLAVEFTLVGGPQVATQGIHGATFISYGVPGNSDEFYMWNPDNLTVRVHGTEYQTGVPVPSGTTHRIGMVWSSTSGALDVLIDGQVVKHFDDVARGYRIPGGGVVALAQDQDSFVLEDGSHDRGHGFATQDAYSGQIFNAAIANGAVNVADLARAPLAVLLDGRPGLVMNMQMSDAGHPIDTTGHHRLHAIGGVSSQQAQVDLSVVVPNPGAALSVTAHATAIASDDHVVRLDIAGFATGTVLSDGVRNHTVADADERVDIHDWRLDHLTATTPLGLRDNLSITLTATTEGPDGVPVTTTTREAVVFDPTRATPDATFGGDDLARGDEDGVLTGNLTVTDRDAGQDHLVAATERGAHGEFTVDEHGDWSFTPDANADALSAGDAVTDRFVVHSADGSSHEVAITLDGLDDQAPPSPPPSPPAGADEPMIDTGSVGGLDGSDDSQPVDAYLSLIDDMTTMDGPVTDGASIGDGGAPDDPGGVSGGADDYLSLVGVQGDQSISAPLPLPDDLVTAGFDSTDDAASAQPDDAPPLAPEPSLEPIDDPLTQTDPLDPNHV